MVRRSAFHFPNQIELKRFIAVSSQIVFVRLLMRRCKWLRESTIKYEMSDKIDHLTPLVQIELVQDSKNCKIIVSRLFQMKIENFRSVSSLDDLDVGLRLLTAEEMRQFSKRFHCQSKSNKSKKVSIENLKNLSHQYKSMFPSTKSNSRDQILIKEFVSFERKSFFD